MVVETDAGLIVAVQLAMPRRCKDHNPGEYCSHSLIFSLDKFGRLATLQIEPLALDNGCQSLPCVWHHEEWQCHKRSPYIHC